MRISVIIPTLCLASPGALEIHSHKPFQQIHVQQFIQNILPVDERAKDLAHKQKP